MSTDVYFDFHSPKSWALWEEPDRWGEWVALLNSKTRRETHYEPQRVSYLSNLSADWNFDLWDSFSQRWSSTLLNSENVGQILSDWGEMYVNSQKPENARDCMPGDILPPERVRIILEGHLGCFLYVRVD